MMTTILTDYSRPYGNTPNMAGRIGEYQKYCGRTRELGMMMGLDQGRKWWSCCIKINLAAKCTLKIDRMRSQQEAE